MIRDIRNIDLKELKTKEKFSVTSIDDLMQFMETNDIPFVNKDISKTGLYKYDLSPNIKSVLYSNGFFYIENLKNKLSYIKNLNGMGTVLFDELSDFIKTSRYRKIEDI